MASWNLLSLNITPYPPLGTPRTPDNEVSGVHFVMVLLPLLLGLLLSAATATDDVFPGLRVAHFSLSQLQVRSKHKG